MKRKNKNRVADYVRQFSSLLVPGVCKNKPLANGGMEMKKESKSTTTGSLSCESVSYHCCYPGCTDTKIFREGMCKEHYNDEHYLQR